MADAVKWSTLFPKTGGSGRGGAFTGKVFTPAMSPYSVVSGDRLVIPKTDQALVIDPSGLEPDDAFQVIDASRNFDKSPVTIKGDKVSIQIVGTGNDLVLDMIGAGNLWEFIIGNDGNGGKQLLVADSPGYTGDLPAGGGSTPTPANGGGDNKELAGEVDALGKTIDGVARWFTIDKAPTDTTATALGAASTADDKVNHGTFAVDSTTGNIYYWPAGQTAAQGPLGDNNSHWQKVASGGATSGGGKAFAFKNVEYKVGQPSADNDTLTYTANPGEFIRVAFDNLAINPDPNQSIRSQNAVILIPNVDPNNLLPIRIIRDGYKPAGPNAFLPATLIVRKADTSAANIYGSNIMGTWDGFDPQEDKAVGFEMDDPGEYVELTPVVWDNGKMLVWVITSSAYDELDTDVIETTTDVTAHPGQTIIARADLKVTIPDPDLDDPAPITIFHHPMDGITTPFRIDVYITSLNGTFRGVEYYMTVKPPAGQATFALLEPGDWVRLEPFGANDDKFWVITASGGSSDDTVLVTNGFENIVASHGQTVLVRKTGTVTLPEPNIDDTSPITVVLYPEIGKDALLPPIGVDVSIKTVKTENNRGIIGRFGSDQYYVNAEGINMSTVGSWVRFESCGGPDDPFWLITAHGQRGENEA